MVREGITISMCNSVNITFILSNIVYNFNIELFYNRMIITDLLNIPGRLSFIDVYF